jgi:predicted NUDIX family NTP pyrophosphohydrolase
VLKFDKTGEQEIDLSEMREHVEMDKYYPPRNGRFRPRPRLQRSCNRRRSRAPSRIAKSENASPGRKMPVMGEY